MPLPEYIPSDLPQYASSVDRTSFNSAVVQSGDVLMFIESGKLIVKKDDGNFYEIGEGSGGTDVSDTTATPADVLVTAAFYDSTGTRQSGTIPTVSAGISGSNVVVPSGYIAASQTFPVSGGVDVSSTTAEAGGVLSGLVFYDSTGNQTTGTIPTVSAAVSGSNVVVPVGYIGTSQTFPVTGGGIDLSSTTAVSSGVLSGLVFYDSDGDKTTGTIPTVSPFVSGSNVVVIPSGYLPVSLAVPLSGGVDVSSTTITSDMVLSGGIFYDSAGVQRSGTIPTVSAIRSDSEIIVPRGYISSPQQFNVSGGVDVSDTTAEDYMVMSGALFYDSDGNLTTGTIPYISAPEDMITPTTSYQTISGGGYLDMDIVIEGDPYLVPQNIKAGVWIFGVEGTYGDFSDVTADPEDVLEDEVFYDSNGTLRSGTIPYAVVPDYWITPTTTSQQIGSGYLEDNVIIAGDSNLVASNIRSGVVIFDVEGTYEGGSSTDFSSTTAVPGGVLSGGVFYDSTGALTTGTIPTVTASIVDNNVVVPAGYIAASQTFPISSGVDAVAGYYVNNSGTVSFQPLTSGASAEAVSSMHIVNTGVAEPEYVSGGGGSTMNFYKCASVTAASSETFYLMSGAGESGCNGTWSATTSSSYDQPIYQNEYGATMVYQGYDTWEIDAPSGDIAWYIGVGSTDPSQITSWTGAGMSPAPSITESSSSTAATWAGYLASVDSSTGIWNFASAVTSGLTYDRLTPVVGNVYDAGCTFRVSDFAANMIDEYTQFYINGNLTDQSPNHIAVANEGLTFDGTKIICANNAYAYIPANTLPVTVLNEGYDWTVEIKFKCEDVSALGSRHGLFGNDGEFDQSGHTVRFDTFEYNSEFVTGSWKPVGGSGNMVVPWTRDTNVHILKYCHYASTGYIEGYLDDVLKVTGEKAGSDIRVYTREFMNPIGATGASTELSRFGYPFSIYYIRISNCIRH